mgnify:CR=1 FL=1
MAKHVIPSNEYLFGSSRTADPCERKHGGNENSVDAHAKASESKEQRYQEIVGLLAAAAGEEGLTGKEIAALLGVSFNSISGRYTEMLATGRIVRLSIKREGSGVLVLARYRP